MSDHDDASRSDRLEALESEQVAAFRAFQRSSRPEDHDLGDDPSAAPRLEPPLNPDLARRVYDGPEGTIDLVPGPDTICCIATAARSGERLAGSTSTMLAAGSAHGFIKSDGAEPSATFIGVLSTAASDLRIITGSGHAIAVPLSADDAYWITVADPIDMILTLADGTSQHIPLARPWAT